MWKHQLYYYFLGLLKSKADRFEMIRGHLKENDRFIRKGKQQWKKRDTMNHRNPLINQNTQ